MGDVQSKSPECRFVEKKNISLCRVNISIHNIVILYDEVLNVDDIAKL